MTFPPFALYLWLLKKQGKLTDFELLWWMRCQYPDGFGSEDFFEEGMQPSAKTPDD